MTFHLFRSRAADYFCASSACKDCVNQLLEKDERRRLGSRSGASEVKRFAKINWGLLRNTRPPVCFSLLLFRPELSAKSFFRSRQLTSFSTDHTFLVQGPRCGQFPPHKGIQFLASRRSAARRRAVQRAWYTRCRSRRRTRFGRADLFEAFSSVTLHYDGES